MSVDRAARNANCCGHAASDHDLFGCAVDVSTDRRAYERCHLLVPAADEERAQIDADMAAAYAEIVARCTCPGGWENHDDESACPNSPDCFCGPYFAPFCPRHGDPEPLS